MFIHCILFFQSLSVGTKYENTGGGKEYPPEDKKKRPLWPGRQGFIVPSRRKQFYKGDCRKASLVKSPAQSLSEYVHCYYDVHDTACIS